MDKKIATVVVTYNRKQLLLENLQKLLAQTYDKFDIMIIDTDVADILCNMFHDEHTPVHDVLTQVQKLPVSAALQALMHFVILSHTDCSLQGGTGCI